METYLIIAIPVLLGFSALFSGSETALFSLSKSELFRMSDGSPRERRIWRLMREPQKVLITILLCNLLVNILISMMITEFLLSIFPDFGQYVAIAVATPLVIIFGEITPKILMMSANVKSATTLVDFLYLFYLITTPIRFAALGLTNILIRILGIEFRESVAVTEGEIDAAIELSHASGTLDSDETALLRNIMRFSKKNAQSVMIPRKDVVALEYGTSIDDAILFFRKHREVRVPVYNGDLDSVVGILDSRYLLPYIHGLKKAATINRLLLEVNHFPASRDLASLVNDFLRKRIQMAVVIDEYGGTMGMVTLAGIIAEVMGDEFMLSNEEQRNGMRKTEAGIIISGDMQIVDFNESFDESIESSESETVAGYIIESLGRMPRKADTIHAGSHELRIRSLRRNRIESIEVVKEARDAGHSL
jgi:putative hemolysin